MSGLVWTWPKAKEGSRLDPLVKMIHVVLLFKMEKSVDWEKINPNQDVF